MTKKKLKQIILNKIHFLILKNDFCFEFFTKINHYNTFHCTGLTFWKLSRTIELYICLTPGVCMITIEHDGLFLTLRRTLWFFSYICTKKKNMREKIWQDYIILTTWVKHFLLKFPPFKWRKKKLLIILLFFRVLFELTPKEKRNERKKKREWITMHN